MIEVSNIIKSYKKEVVLDIEQLHIGRGEVLGLIGNNGAGKTTLFSLLLDLIKANQGHITNKEIRVDQSEDWKSHTAAFLDESFLIGYLSPEEYFTFIGSLRGLNKQEVLDFVGGFEDFFNGEVLNKKKYIRDFSKGNMKKIGIVAAFIGEPEIVILDEPFANLDPSTQIRLKTLILHYTEKHNGCLLISSHDLHHITDVCNRIVLLDKGKVVKDNLKSEQTLVDLKKYFENEIAK